MSDQVTDKIIAFIFQYPIFKERAAEMHHAQRATCAFDRAVIFLRMLVAEPEWSDGYERKIDDCFEMSDGDAVCGWLLEMADFEPRIKTILKNHRTVGPRVLADWEKYRGKHTDQIPLAL